MKKKILVCDDALEILEVINIILSENGYQVETIDECTNLIAKIKEFEPDLILLDLWIKRCDGREVAKQIHSDPEISDIPIIFVSALNELDKIADEANVQGFIKKPFEIDDLLAKVEAVLTEDNE